MKKPAHHLQKRLHHDYNKSMLPAKINAFQNRRLLFLTAALLLVLILAFAYYLNGQKKPGKSAPPPASTQATLPPLPAHSLGCPLPESFCKSADFYSTRIKDSSFSAILKENTPLLAVFDGLAESMQLSRPLPNGKKEDFTLLTIVNRKQKLVAEYYLNGKAIGEKEVKEGEQIATVSGQPLNFLEGKSLVLVVLGLTGEGDSGLEPLTGVNFK